MSLKSEDHRASADVLYSHRKLVVAEMKLPQSMRINAPRLGTELHTHGDAEEGESHSQTI